MTLSTDTIKALREALAKAPKPLDYVNMTTDWGHFLFDVVEHLPALLDAAERLAAIEAGEVVVVPANYADAIREECAKVADLFADTYEAEKRPPCSERVAAAIVIVSREVAAAIRSSAMLAASEVG